MNGAIAGHRPQPPRVQAGALGRRATMAGALPSRRYEAQLEQGLTGPEGCTPSWPWGHSNGARPGTCAPRLPDTNGVPRCLGLTGMKWSPHPDVRRTLSGTNQVRRYLRLGGRIVRTDEGAPAFADLTPGACTHEMERETGVEPADATLATSLPTTGFPQNGRCGRYCPAYDRVWADLLTFRTHSEMAEDHGNAPCQPGSKPSPLLELSPSNGRGDWSCTSTLSSPSAPCY
jgi:hypothetical protein